MVATGELLAFHTSGWIFDVLLRNPHTVSAVAPHRRFQRYCEARPFRYGLDIVTTDPSSFVSEMRNCSL